MGTVRSCPQCGNRKCKPNREKAPLPVEGESSTPEGLPAPLLRKKLHDASAVCRATAENMEEGHLDVSTSSALMQIFDMLTFQACVAQACIISASYSLESLSIVLPGPGDGPRLPHVGPSPYREIRVLAADCLDKIGRLFDALGPAFENHAFPSSGESKRWHHQQVDVAVEAAPVTGKGYLDTFQDNALLTSEDRRTAYLRRLQRFQAAGGSFLDILHLRPTKGKHDGREHFFEHQVTREASSSTAPLLPRANDAVTEADLQAERSALSDLDNGNVGWRSLVAGQWYDYVVALDHSIRCYPNSPAARGAMPKCGHSLLAPEDPAEINAWIDEPVVMAGELCPLRDSQGNLTSLVLTNNSGHFKPRPLDLANAVTAFVKLGVPRDSICTFAGPNSLLALKRDLASAQGVSIEDLAKIVAGENLLNPYMVLSQWEKQR